MAANILTPELVEALTANMNRAYDLLLADCDKILSVILQCEPIVVSYKYGCPHTFICGEHTLLLESEFESDEILHAMMGQMQKQGWTVTGSLSDEDHGTMSCIPPASL